ncbi:hypothetical protein [Flavobacterium aestivum]|uniref:hypothetical protein n=1 Tax=Flavobacterium aestivum TaxID=3003257 RepID=UPI0024832C95|nr:hypothetical protein [Flavobacterium aestivum]
MIIINADENGLGKPKWMRNVNLKNAVKATVAPQTLILKKHPKRPPPPPPPPPPIYDDAESSYNETDSFEDSEEQGLGRSKRPKKGLKKLVRKVNLKNTIKVAKFAGPLVAGIIPGGGTAMKVLDSKVGKTVMKVAKSKIVKKGVKLAQSKVGRAVVNQARAKIEGVSEIEPRGFSETAAKEIAINDTNSSTNTNTSEAVNEPVGELTPVKQVEPVTEKLIPPDAGKKNNTMLYVIGAVVIVGGIYMATKKK